jgi:hypothetical protein
LRIALGADRNHGPLAAKMERPAGRVKLHPMTGEDSKTNNKVSTLDSNETCSYGFEVAAGDGLVAGGN